MNKTTDFFKKLANEFTENKSVDYLKGTVAVKLFCDWLDNRERIIDEMNFTADKRLKWTAKPKEEILSSIEQEISEAQDDYPRDLPREEEKATKLSRKIVILERIKSSL